MRKTVMLIMLISSVAIAQEIAPPTGDEVSGFLGVVLNLIKGGATGIAIGMAFVQGGMLLLRSSLGEKAGKWRYLAVAGLSFLAAAFGVVIAGKPWMEIFTDAATVAAFNVFFHQAIIQFKQS